MAIFQKKKLLHQTNLADGTFQLTKHIKILHFSNFTCALPCIYLTKKVPSPSFRFCLGLGLGFKASKLLPKLM